MANPVVSSPPTGSAIARITCLGYRHFDSYVSVFTKSRHSLPLQKHSTGGSTIDTPPSNCCRRGAYRFVEQYLVPKKTSSDRLHSVAASHRDKTSAHVNNVQSFADSEREGQKLRCIRLIRASPTCYRLRLSLRHGGSSTSHFTETYALSCSDGGYCHVRHSMSVPGYLCCRWAGIHR